MKVGDKLYCHTNVIVVNNNTWDTIDFSDDFYIGDIYIISKVYEEVFIDVPNQIIVDSDNGYSRWFFIENTVFDAARFYRNWFYTEKDLRKIKLEKLRDESIM